MNIKIIYKDKKTIRYSSDEVEELLPEVADGVAELGGAKQPQVGDDQPEQPPGFLAQHSGGDKGN